MGNNSELKLHLVEQFLHKKLVGIDGIDEAVYWANELNLNESMLCATDADLISKARSEGRGKFDLSTSVEIPESNLFHKLSICEDKINFVSTLEQFSEMLDFLSKQVILTAVAVSRSKNLSASNLNLHFAKDTFS